MVAAQVSSDSGRRPRSSRVRRMAEAQTPILLASTKWLCGEWLMPQVVRRGPRAGFFRRPGGMVMPLLNGALIRFFEGIATNMAALRA